VTEPRARDPAAHVTQPLALIGIAVHSTQSVVVLVLTLGLVLR
jgi:hypothetical protein